MNVWRLRRTGHTRKWKGLQEAGEGVRPAAERRDTCSLNGQHAFPGRARGERKGAHTHPGTV